MFVIKNKILPIGNYSTINLFGILFTKRKRDLDTIVLNHESIHTYLLIELGLSGSILLILLTLITNISWWWLLLAPCTFYIWYGIEYLIVRCFHKKQKDAYHDVSFEEEAYKHEDDLGYLDTRKLFSFIKYIKIKRYANK